MGVISIGKIQCGKDLTCVDNMDTVTSNNGPNGHVWYIAYIRILTFKNWLCPKRIILWLEEILSHHRWLKPYQSWYKQHPSTSLNLCKFFSTHSVSGGKTSVPFYQHHQAQVYSWFGWFNPSAEQIHLTCHPNLPTNCHQYTYIVIFSQSIFFFISYIYTYMHAPKKEWEAVRSFGQGDGWWSCQGARLVRHRGAGSGGMMCFFCQWHKPTWGDHGDNIYI
jgi:hypothetical protein